ncbi:hypothetical protein LguiB_035027 [Lonicera macranthoides]
MGSYSGTCEIIESKEELNSSQHSYQERKPPLLKQGRSSSLEDDINKLFEAINLKHSSKGQSLPDQGEPRKNTMKKPMRMSMSSSGIGFSDPVPLKQALRGLCLSQASEMAAMKRLSKPSGSPSVSESGKLTTSLYRSVVVEAGESDLPLVEGQGGRVEITLMPEESKSNYSENVPQHYQESKIKSSCHSAHSSPRFTLETTKGTGSTLQHNEIVPASKIKPAQEENNIPALEQAPVPPPLPHISDEVIVPDKNIAALVKLANNRDKSVSSSIRLPSKAIPKLRRKCKFQSIPSSSSPVNGNKVHKSARNPPRVVKPPIRNKNFVKKKPKQDSNPVTSSSSTNKEVVNGDLPSTSQLFCQKCHCTLEEESGKECPVPLSTSITAPKILINGSNGASRSSPTLNGNPVAANINKNAKSREKGEFSQSSKSSMGDYSSSTSISEESNLSGSSFGNRPHMSKDLRWEAIHHVMKLHGFLGLRHFNLLKKLGFGDIGTVYLAQLIGTSCLFAIKVMDIEFLGRRKKMPRAQTEREILKILDHPFLPTLYAHFISDNLSCLVMEYCPGGDLHVLRQKQPGRYFPEQAARFYVAEVLLALEYLHMLGVVYRDLKPENILVREDGHIMLTDFDLSLRCSVNPTLLKSPSLCMDPPRMSGPCAGSNCIDPFCIKHSCQVSCFSPRLLPGGPKSRKAKPDPTAQARSLPQLVAEPTDARSNSFVGTHEYLAPEIIKGEGHGSAVDWWTFGVFLYELLYGKTPFKGMGNDETLANVVMNNLKFPDTPLVSFQARDLIRGLLVKEPENRLGSERGAAEIKQHPFFEGLNWALIRCAFPPQIPEPYDFGVPKIGAEEEEEEEEGKKYLECGVGGKLEFELF